MQNSTLRFGTFVFGPVVLRMIHHLKKPDLGIQLVKDSVSYFIFGIHFYSFTFTSHPQCGICTCDYLMKPKAHVIFTFSGL